MIVMKFGGTSVATAPRLRAVADIVAGAVSRTPVVVVSALSGVTNLLEDAARAAQARSGEAVAGPMEEIRRRHAEALGAVENELEAKAVAGRIDAILAEATLLTQGIAILGEATPRSLDAVLACGERAASHIAAAVLRGRGLPARRVDARQVIVTDDRHGAARPLPEPIAHRSAGILAPLLASGAVPVLGGYIGSTAEGITSTLGRGGSDLTASLLGAALGAEEIQIWTDVDGMMTADPRHVPTARLLPAVSFDEAAELAYFGARVLHPDTIHPAVEKDIPVRVLNTLRPSSPGTRITGGPLRESFLPDAPVAPGPSGGRADTVAVPAFRGGMAAIACKRGLTVVTVASTRMLMAHGFLARIFEVFDRHRTPVDLVATSEVSVSLTVDDPRSLAAVVEELSAFSTVRVEEGMAIVCMVGEGLLHRSGIAARVFEALREVNVRMISLGASEINLSLVVAAADADEAVRSLHRAFFEG